MMRSLITYIFIFCTRYFYAQPCGAITVDAGVDQGICNSSTAGLNAVPEQPSDSGYWTYITVPAPPSVPSFFDETLATTAVYNLDEGDYYFIWNIKHDACPIISDTVKITISDPTNSNAGANQQICGANSAVLFASIPVGTAKGKWSIDSTAGSPTLPLISNTANAITNASNMIEGTYFYVWTVSNGSCPIDRDTVKIDIFNSPFAITGSDKDLCIQDSTELNANTPLGRSSGYWHLDYTANPPPPNTPVFDSFNPATKVNGLITGDYRFIWSVENTACPTARDTLLVKNYSPATAYAGADSSLCGIHFIDLYASPWGGNNIGRWKYDTAMSDFTPPIVDVNLPNSPVNLQEGKYFFICDVSAGACGTVSDTVKISIYDPQPADAGIDFKVCDSSYLSLNATVPPGIAWGIWYKDPSFPNPNNPVFSNPFNPNTDVANLVYGEYRLLWTVFNGVCPPQVDTVKLENYPNPQANFHVIENSLCEGGCLTYYQTSYINPQDVIVEHQWHTEGLPTVSGDSIVQCFDVSGSYQPYVVAISSNGCYDTGYLSSSIDVHPNPTAGFFVDYTGNTDNSRVNIVDASIGANSYEYTMGDGAIFNVPEFIHKYSDSGFYNIQQIVSNSFGCQDTAYELVFVNELLAFVPNAFSPDGDGVNEGFFPDVSGYDPNFYEFTVYDKWGQIVFNSKTPRESWDGTEKGKPAPIGVYVWTLNVKFISGKGKKKFVGNVTLLRG